MGTIIWSEAYNIGISEIDSQHEKLFGILNELITAYSDGMENAVIIDALIKLTDYTYYHFNAEQEMHSTYKYPKAVLHKTEHNQFIIQLNELKLESEKDSTILTQKTLEFLKDWIITHVLGSDKLFGDYLKKVELQ